MYISFFCMTGGKQNIFDAGKLYKTPDRDCCYSHRGNICSNRCRYIGGTYDQRTWSNCLEAVQLVDCDTDLKITIPMPKRKPDLLSCQITAFIWCLCVCICRTMLEHLFLVGCITGIAVEARKISIYRTFIINGIFYQMMQKKPCKAY